MPLLLNQRIKKTTMGLKFKQKNGKVELEAELLVIKEIAQIVELDTSDAKDTAIRVLKAVYLLSDEESPFSDMTETERYEQTVYNCSLTEQELALYGTLLQEAVGIYILTNVTAIRRAIDALDKTIDQTSEMLASTVPYIRRIPKRRNIGTKEEPEWEEYIEFQSNSDEIADYSEKLNKLIVQREELYVKYIKKKDAGELRSGKQAGGLASGKFKNPVLSGTFER